MRSKPDNVEAVLLKLLFMLLMLFLMLQLFIRAYLRLIKVYLILIEAITVVNLASRPCLDHSLTLLLPCLNLSLTLPGQVGYDGYVRLVKFCRLGQLGQVSLARLFMLDQFGQVVATLGLHLGFSAKRRIWQVPICKMEPQSGTIITD